MSMTMHVLGAKLTIVRGRLTLVYANRQARLPRIEVTKHAVRVGCISVSRAAIDELIRIKDMLGVVQEEGEAGPHRRL